MATHRYQDGHFLATYRYNPQSGQAEQVTDAEKDGLGTVFMVLSEGKIAFEGNLAELNASPDPYVMKFIPREE